MTGTTPRSRPVLRELRDDLNPFYRVRWADGRIARLSSDRIALTLSTIGWLQFWAGLATILLLEIDGTVPWLILIAVGLVLDVLVKRRLRWLVRAAEARDSAVAADRSTEPADGRLWEFMARRCDESEAKYRARAARAEDAGDERAADKYRRRADRERRWAAQCRDNRQSI